MNGGVFITRSNSHYAGLEQPRWPAEMNSTRFQKNVRQMYADVAVQSSNVIISELVRAIDCRLAELLYYLGMYPERWWVSQGQQMSISRKIKMAMKIFPRIVIPRTLMHHVKNIRNLAEHQYENPRPEDIHTAYEVMELFFMATQQFLDILSETSVFHYNIPQSDQPIVVQILREEAALFIALDGSSYMGDKRIGTTEPEAQTLIRKVLSDIQRHLEIDPGFMTKMGFV